MQDATHRQKGVGRCHTGKVLEEGTWCCQDSPALSTSFHAFVSISGQSELQFLQIADISRLKIGQLSQLLYQHLTCLEEDCTKCRLKWENWAKLPLMDPQ